MSFLRDWRKKWQDSQTPEAPLDKDLIKTLYQRCEKEYADEIVSIFTSLQGIKFAHNNPQIVSSIIFRDNKESSSFNQYDHYLLLSRKDWPEKLHDLREMVEKNLNPEQLDKSRKMPNPPPPRRPRSSSNSSNS